MGRLRQPFLPLSRMLVSVPEQELYLSHAIEACLVTHTQ